MPHLTQATWDDVPHLSKKQKDEFLLSFPPHQREARSKGVPQLGAGAVYPIQEEEIICEPFEIPAHWPRGFGLDVGWNRWACVWIAYDRQSNVVYAYDEYYQGSQPPNVHAWAIRQRGPWIPGVIDPASRGRSQIDGRRILDLLKKESLILVEADNAIEAGIYDVWQRLQAGSFKIFKKLVNLRQEYRLYRRDPKNTGHIVKPKLPQELPEGRSAAEYGDHLLDATRYAIRSFLPSTGTARASLKTEPPKAGPSSSSPARGNYGAHGWMA